MASTPKKVDPKALGNATKKTTEKGPHGGGTKYHQNKVGSGFAVHNPIPGQMGKKNTK